VRTILLVRRDGRVETTTLPTKLKQPFFTLATERHIIAQLAQDALIAGRKVPAETLIAYDTTRELPHDRRLGPRGDGSAWQ
jgi:hypothetical protein